MGVAFSVVAIYEAFLEALYDIGLASAVLELQEIPSAGIELLMVGEYTSYQINNIGWAVLGGTAAAVGGSIILGVTLSGKSIAEQGYNFDFYLTPNTLAENVEKFMCATKHEVWMGCNGGKKRTKVHLQNRRRHNRVRQIHTRSPIRTTRSKLRSRRKRVK